MSRASWPRQFIFISGQTPVQDGRIVGPSIEDQAQVVFGKLQWILGEVGATFHDVVRCGVFLNDLDDLGRFNVVYQQAFGKLLPARTTVGARLPGYRVEVDCIAVVPTDPVPGT